MTTRRQRLTHLLIGCSVATGVAGLSFWQAATSDRAAVHAGIGIAMLLLVAGMVTIYARFEKGKREMAERNDPADNAFNRRANKILEKHPLLWGFVIFGIFIAAALFKAFS